jgi:hypothetical protein
MLIRILGLFAILLALTAVPQAQRSRFPVADESTITRTLTFGGGGDRAFDLRLINGSIRVVGTDQDAVQITLRKVIRAESDADLADAQREVALDFVDRRTRIEAIVRDRNGYLCGEHSQGRNNERSRPRYEVSFDAEVQVPRTVNLRLCTINGGDVRVEGTTGDFEVSNVNGRIDMEQVAGSGSARTVNGPVTVSFTENPREASVFHTVNGNVVVRFQDGLAADLKMKTFNGGLFTDFDVQPLAQDVTGQTERRTGRFVYRASDFTQVRAGGGGPEHTFETLNGNVRALRGTR